MSQTLSLFRIFVASPSDVQAEREILESIILEVNRSWSESLGINLQLVRWETHVRPGFGDSPQDVINIQVGDNFDAFIGILWARFGTPTKKAASGTKEEFDRAFARFKETGSPEIMLYFKESDVPMENIDPDQLKKVQDFKKSINEKGGIYSSFKDEKSFESSLRAHLTSLAQYFSRQKQENTQIIERNDIIYEENQEEDVGYIEYFDEFITGMDFMTESLSEINNATTTMGSQIKERVKEINSLSHKGPTSAEARRVFKRTSEDMDQYANVMEDKLPAMIEARKSSLNALTKSISLYEDFGYFTDSGIGQLQEILESTRMTISTSLNQVVSLRENVMKLPRITGSLVRAKRRVVKNLTRIINEFSEIVDNLTNIELSIVELTENRLIKNFPSKNIE
tara:strand:- start:4 stop:1194 length:1191 start_codon:yes stop_codon:yes gene_type:complete